MPRSVYYSTDLQLGRLAAAGYRQCDASRRLRIGSYWWSTTALPSGARVMKPLLGAMRA